MKPNALKKGDKVAIVSLSSGVLGEAFCAHQLELGTKRIESFGLVPVFMPNSLKGLEFIANNPEARAEDLKKAFLDSEIKGIICAIGGEDTYKTVSYLLDDPEFIDAVKNNPKVFSGFSDTTVNHLMFNKLGLTTYYGVNFLTDFAELDKDMIPYTKTTFESYFKDERKILSSDIWYEDRTDFSANSLNVPRVSHKEARGYEVLFGSGKVSGKLLGGCLESFYCLLTDEKQRVVCDKYELFPSAEEWNRKILFIEPAELTTTPEEFEKQLVEIGKYIPYNNLSAIIFGKPTYEVYYDEYKAVINELFANLNVPIMYNINFGHAIPRCLIAYNVTLGIDFDKKELEYEEPAFNF